MTTLTVALFTARFIVGAYVLVHGAGPGAWSVDNRLGVDGPLAWNWALAATAVSMLLGIGTAIALRRREGNAASRASVGTSRAGNPTHTSS